MDKITNLPDAIRVGALKHPQAFGRLRLSVWTTGVLEPTYRTCAIGSALDAVGVTNFSIGSAWREETMKRFDVDCNLVEYIVGLNDQRKLSRETIAAILVAREWKEYTNTESPWPL